MSLLLAFDPASVFIIILVIFGAPVFLIGAVVFAWRARNASQDGEADPAAGEDRRQRPLHTVVSNRDE